MPRKADRSKTTHSKKSREWSADVMKRSNALDLEPDVFTKDNPRQIALSLRNSAMRSKRRRGTPYQSAMSMLNFHINRAGKGLERHTEIQIGRGKSTRPIVRMS